MELKGMKNMLLGIAIMLAVILVRLVLTGKGYLTTDLLAIIGIIFVIKGYCQKEKEPGETKDGEET